MYPSPLGHEPQLLLSVREATQRAGSLESALRAALQRICAATGWQAARVEFSDHAGELSSRSVWHLERPERLPKLLPIAEQRRARREGLVGTVLRDGAPQWRPGAEDGTTSAIFAFPAVAHHKTLAAVEFFSAASEPPDDALLSGITRACAELGRVIEQKPAEDMLRKVERSYRDLFESVSEALVVVDPRTGIIQDANPRASELYGVPRERMLGASVHGLWSDAGVARAAIARGRRFETVLRRGTLETVLEVSASPVQYHGEQATLLLTREVTQRVRVLDALRASEERYRILFENNPQPMWVEDAETGMFLAVNEAAVRHYGWTREKFLTMRSADLRLDPSAAAEQRSGAPAVERHRTSSGEAHDLELSVHEVVFESRRALLVAATDVTARRKAQARLLAGRLLRPAHRPAQPRPLHGPPRAWPCPGQAAARRRGSRCSSSTSIASSWSTTASATAPATSCCGQSRGAWRAAAAPETRWRGWAATSSPCSSRTSPTEERGHRHRRARAPRAAARPS